MNPPANFALRTTVWHEVCLSLSLAWPRFDRNLIQTVHLPVKFGDNRTVRPCNFSFKMTVRLPFTRGLRCLFSCKYPTQRLHLKTAHARVHNHHHRFLIAGYCVHGARAARVSGTVSSVCVGVNRELRRRHPAPRTLTRSPSSTRPPRGASVCNGTRSNHGAAIYPYRYRYM